MGVPTVVSTSPATGESSVYKNKVLTATFSEALLSSTVNAGTFVLKNLDSNQIVPVDVTLSTSGLVVSVTPVRHMIGTTAYKLTIVGANTAVGTPVQAADASPLATTLLVTFTTNDTIEATAAQKTDAEIALEGEIDLPTNWTIAVDSSELSIIASDPVNREFAIEATLDDLEVEFSAALDTSTVTAATFLVTVGPYYEEDEDYLAYPDTSDGAMNFQWEDPQDVANVDMDFTDLSGTLSVNGSVVTWTADETRDFPRNTKIDVVMTTGIQSVTGNAMASNYKISFFIKPFPYLVSVDRIRDEFYPYVLTNWTDDMIGKAIYKNSLDALTCMRYVYDFRNPNRTFAKYVIAQTVVDIFFGLRIEEDLLAGQFKKLGDLAVRYDVKSVDAIPPKMKKAMDDARDLKDALRGRWTKSLHTVVKGRLHPEQRNVWRTRLWRQDIALALEGAYAGSETAGNTASQRTTRVAGKHNRWG